MRITGGQYKNHSLTCPKHAFVRPTSEKLRQMVFNICQHQVADSTFLDVFAGTGAMGIEALSRGASHATFIEKHPLGVKTIHENLAHLKLQEQATVLSGDAVRFLKVLIKKQSSFDLIYIDPPYGKKDPASHLTLLDTILQLIDGSSILKKGGLLFCEESESPTIELTHLSLTRERKVGTTTLFQLETTS